MKDDLRKEFERWFEHVLMGGLNGPGDFDAKRNCYVVFGVHMAWKGYQAVAAERDALRADAEAAHKLIDEHNADCTSQCAGRKMIGKTSCYMVDRMGSCHDCPLDFMIEPAIHMGKESSDGQ